MGGAAQFEVIRMRYVHIQAWYVRHDDVAGPHADVTCQPYHVSLITESDTWTNQKVVVVGAELPVNVGQKGYAQLLLQQDTQLTFYRYKPKS